MRSILAPITLLTLCGCVTHDWVAKSVSGRVVDAESGRPLAGVSIYRVIEAKRVFVATTDSTGQFSVAPAGKVYVTLPLGDAFYRSSLVFQAIGYGQQSLDCSTMTGDVGGWKAPSLASVTVKLRKI